MQCCGLGSKKSKVVDSETTTKAPAAAHAPAPAAAPTPTPAPAPVPAAAAKPATMAPTKIAVLYYSTYGHVAQLAKKELEGANSVEGVEAALFRIPEILSKDILAKMHAPGPDESVPELDVHDLPNYDGFLIGFPTRYGTPAAQFKAYWDATGSLWSKGALAGKSVGVFFSTATQGGGQESTALTGLVFVPLGYTEPTGLQFGLTEIQGGSAWGAGTFAAGDGSRQPSDNELAIAKHQGEYFAKIAKKLAA